MTSKPAPRGRLLGRRFLDSNSSFSPSSFGKRLRRLLLGSPIHSKYAHHQKLPVLLGLPVFSADALSSVAYATEAILSVLVLISAKALGFSWPITLAICALIAIVVASYRQTIYAYPKGGGSYIVASENLGRGPGLVAGAALLIDYILTVAVSIAAGVAAITSAFPHLHAYLPHLSLLAIAGVAWANLRGLRESGVAFAIPTYGFVLALLTMIVMGVFQTFGQPVVEHQQVVSEAMGREAHYPLIFVLLRAFAAGCTALTGIEAVSDGVPAFKDPASKNAARTLVLMAILLLTLFIGIGYLVQHMPALELHETKNPEYRTLVSQMAAQFLGQGSLLFYVVQFATAAILILAANTGFADFPRLASFLARDRFLPRPLLRQGDRLVFTNGIILLALAAGGLIWIFHGELDMLLPLYAVGVFTAFTISQTGMVFHWLRDRTPGRWGRLTINGIGAVTTCIVAVIILGTKFAEGAWIVAVLIGVVITIFVTISRHYQRLDRQLSIETAPPSTIASHTVLVIVNEIDRSTLRALDYARKLAGDTRGIHVTLDQKAAQKIVSEWRRVADDLPLVVLESPFRSLTEPVLEYLDNMAEEEPDRVVTVCVPEVVSANPAHRIFQESLALQLKLALGARRNVVVSSVRYHLQ